MSRKRREPARLGGALCALALGLTPSAASAEDTRESQLWTGAFLTAALPSDSERGLALWTDLQARRGPDGTLVLARPALGYRFDGFTSLWGGYAWIGSFPEGEADTSHEHRAWQQVLIQYRWGPIALQLRPRGEQRFRTGEDVAFRARLFGRANVRWWHDGPLALAFWNETFVALHETSWGAPAGFDQNRLFLGPAFGSATLRLEAGYLSVVVRRPDASLQVMHNAALFGFLSF